MGYTAQADINLFFVSAAALGNVVLGEEGI